MLDGGPPNPIQPSFTCGSPADFDDERALAAYVGVVPALRHSEKNQRATLV